MSAPSNAREALIAELVGEVSALLDRVDGLVAAINATCDAITRAGADLETNASQAERRIAALTEAAKAYAVKHIAQRTEALTRSSAEVQLEAIRQATHEIVRAELVPALQSLLRRHPAHAAETGARWWTYATTAICSAALGAAVATYALSAFAP